VALGVIVGGGIGAVLAKKVEMTKMPELVAAMHSLIGLAAVCIAVAAVSEPHAFGIAAVGEALPVTASSCSSVPSWRDYLLRFGDRVRQAVGQIQVPPVPGRAGELRRPAHAEPDAGDGDGRPGPGVCGGRRQQPAWRRS
jgi:hypothetical protein